MGSGRKAQGGGEAGARPCSVGCLSVPPAREGADGGAGAEMTEVGVQWVFTELWAVWLEPGTEEREGVRTRGSEFRARSCVYQLSQSEELGS